MRGALSLSEAVEVAKHQATIFAPHVHAITFTEIEGFAVVAGFKFSHPTAVAVGLEAIFPNLPERVLVDVPLIVFASYARACRNTAIDENGCNAESGCTVVEIVANLAFVIA